MPPTREQFEQALDRLTYPNHPDGQPDLDNHEAAIRGYVDHLEEQLESGPDDWPLSMSPAEYLDRYPEGDHAEAAAEILGVDVPEVEEEEEEEEPDEDEEIPTSTGEGGSMEDVPGT